MASIPIDLHQNAQEFVRICCGPLLMVGDVDWNKASFPTGEYNCMGLAMQIACGFLEWWQPPERQNGVVVGRWYWPDGIPEDSGIDAYIQAAATVGFKVTNSPNWEENGEKVTLYHLNDKNRTFKHAVRWLSPNTRASKIGEYSDFEHRPDALDQVAIYGGGRVYLIRQYFV